MSSPSAASAAAIELNQSCDFWNFVVSAFGCRGANVLRPFGCILARLLQELGVIEKKRAAFELVVSNAIELAGLDLLGHLSQLRIR